MTKESSAKLQGKSVALTQYSKPDFAAFTAGKAAFALVGAAAMIAEGNEIVRENEIQDPAIAIGDQLAKKLVESRHVTISRPSSVASSDKIEDLVSTYAGSELLLDVRTINWMFNYYPSDWAHYKVTYSARVRLIDAANGQAIAETMCQTVQGDDASPPTKDELLANHAALLKHYLGQGAAACTDVLAKDLFQL